MLGCELMRKNRSRLIAGVALVAALTASSQAHALKFVLTDIGGAAIGTQAYGGFKMATDYWSSVLTNDVTINLNIGFSALPTGVLGSTNAPRVGVLNSDVYALLNANTAKSALDVQAVANLPTLNANGALDVITSGYQNPMGTLGVNTATRVLDDNDTANNFGLAITRANAKALGFTGLTGADATIRFSSAFAFDFNPLDGISNNSFDFLGIAIHEVGHALGFVSGVDSYDQLGTPNGPAAGGANAGTNFQDFVINSVLDLYRYSSDPLDLAPGAGAFLDWSVGGNPYFSVDGGATMLTLGGTDGRFSTGQFNGDGRQASHFKDNTYAGGALCSNPTKTPIGILDPTAGRCEELAVTAMDIAAFDVMGWNTKIDVLANPGYIATTESIAAPEPSTWIQMILGFGGLGMVARANRRRKLVRVRA